MQLLRRNVLLHRSLLNIACRRSFPPNRVHFQTSMNQWRFFTVKHSEMSATGRATTRFKEMWKRYGAVAIGTYLSTYAVVLGSFYASIEYGLIDRNPPKPNLSDSDDDFNLVKTTNR